MSKNSLQLFLSYAREDDELRRGLSAHLAPLRHQGLITVWTDRAIQAGVEWETELFDNLDQSDLIVLLISSDFINSGYSFGVEMRRALARHEAGAARVIPVLARPCLWSGLPFAKLQVLPTEAVPITTWPNRDSAYLSVVQGIEDAARKLLAGSHSIVSEWVSALLARRKVVRGVQAFLQARGLYAGAIDGDPANVHLREAVRRYQHAAELQPDGLIGPETLRSIRGQADFSESAFRLP